MRIHMLWHCHHACTTRVQVPEAPNLVTAEGWRKRRRGGGGGGGERAVSLRQAHARMHSLANMNTPKLKNSLNCLSGFVCELLLVCIQFRFSFYQLSRSHALFRPAGRPPKGPRGRRADLRGA